MTHRERLLAAAIESVAARGYAGASVAELAQQAGLSKTTFYRYFDGKDDCFLAACDAALAALLDEVEVAAAAATNPAERVQSALRALLEGLADRPAVARACVTELPSVGPAGQSLHERFLARLVTTLVGAPASGEGALPRLDAQLLGGGVWELIHSTLVHGSARELPSLLPHLRVWVLGFGLASPGSDDA